MKNKENRKNEILNASIKLMHLNGYNGTSVKDITNAAGIPKGSFYNYFDDKEHYAVEALQYYFFEMQKNKVSLLTDNTLEPLERIKKFYREGIANLKTNQQKYGCFIGNTSQEMGDISDSIAEAIVQIFDYQENTIYNNLVEAKVKNQLSTKTDLRRLASFILSSWQGALLRAKVMRNNNALDDFYNFLNEELLK